MPFGLNFARRSLFVIGLALSGCANSDDAVTHLTPVTPTNAAGGLAVKGYDPVSYRTDNSAVPGRADITSAWHGATYRFASDAHRAAFVANPEHFAPQYGGFCAYAISEGRIADIEPDHFTIANDRLYLNNNLIAHQLFRADPPGHIVHGDHNWPLVPKLPEAPI